MFCFLLVLILSAGLAWGLGLLAMIPWRRAAGAHWTEQARRLFPARKAAMRFLFLLPACAALARPWLGPLSALPWQALAAAAFAGALLGSYPVSHAVYPTLTTRHWLGLILIGGALHLLPGWVVLACGIFMPDSFDASAATIGTAAVAVIVLNQLGLTLRAVRRAGWIMPAPERLNRIVRAQAVQMGIACRAISVLRHPAANAFAFPLLGELYFTDGLLDSMRDEEIAAISAHELAHLAESRAARAGRFLGSLAFLPLVFLRPCVHALGTAGYLLPFLAFALMARLSRRLSRRLETRADAMGTGQDATGVYARALERLYELNKMPAVLRGKNLTHPHLYDRLIAAGVTPAFPRPRPPARHAWTEIPVLILLIVLIVFRSLQIGAGP